MSAGISRRGFIGGAAAFLGAAGCRSLLLSSGRPNVAFGVISDIHLTTPESTARLERTLRYFRARGADAVMICGDLSDWGLRSGLRLLMDTWAHVFPGGKGPGGRPVARLFCTGNHDLEGWRYADMAVDMHVSGYSEDEALATLGIGKCWEEVFQEPFAPVRRRTVNGYDFVGGEWYRKESPFEGFDKTPEWFAAHGGELDPSRPFFYFQHPPIGRTVNPSPDRDDPVAEALAAHPNAVSFTGHTHMTLNGEMSIWQGAFTALAVPSLSYTSPPRGYENGEDGRRGNSGLSMPTHPSRLDMEEAQGFYVSAYDERLVVERHDFEQMAVAGDAWVVPLPAEGSSRPFSFASHAARTPVPEFPAGAELRLRTANTESRKGRWLLAQMLEFPLADGNPAARAYDYEVRVVPCGDGADGFKPVVRRFLSPAFHKLKKDEPPAMRFWFDATLLLRGVEYRIEVRPRNSFGTCGAPLVSSVRKGAPAKSA